MLIDTNILYYGLRRGSLGEYKGSKVSSVSALEFLKVHNDNLIKPNYYINQHFIQDKFSLSRSTVHTNYTRLYYKKRAHRHINNRIIYDNIYIETQKMGRVYIYNNDAITKILNKKLDTEFKDALFQLNKRVRKEILRRFRFVLDEYIEVIPLDRAILDKSLVMLDKFENKYNVKNRYRNSINDIMILSTAMNQEIHLITEDKLLNRFIAEEYNIPQEIRGEYLDLDFCSQDSACKHTNKESKGYINKGYRYIINCNKCNI